METFEAGFLHRPEQPTGDALVLTHGAGSNCNAPLLVAIAEAGAAAGLLVYRYDLPYRRARPRGSPYPSQAKADRDGVREAVAKIKTLATGRVLVGGHSYGGRQTSMAVAEDPGLAAGLLLMSYPLHPPGKPAQLRTAHFPQIAVPVLFVHGARDPFGSPDEMKAALPEIPSPTELLLLEAAGHDLGKNRGRVASQVLERATAFLLRQPEST